MVGKSPWRENTKKKLILFHLLKILKKNYRSKNISLREHTPIFHIPPSYPSHNMGVGSTLLPYNLTYPPLSSSPYPHTHK